MKLKGSFFLKRKKHAKSKDIEKTKKNNQYSISLAKVEKQKKTRENKNKHKENKRNNIPEVWREGVQPRVLENCYL